MLSWLRLSIALAQSPEAAPPEPPPADPAALGFRLDDQTGWRQEGDRLIGPAGQALAFAFEPATDDEIVALEVKDIVRERAKLVVEMAERKLVARDVEGRIVTTPIGEPGVLLLYTLTAGKGYEGEVPPRGIRIIRRCGPTVRLTDEGEAPDQAALLEAAGQLLWAAPECEQYNTRPFRRVETPEATDPLFVPPPDPEPARPPKPPWWVAWLGVVYQVTGLVVVRLFLALRAPPPKAAPTPRAAPPKLSPTGEDRATPRPEQAPLSPPLAPSNAPPPPEPVLPKKAEPRPLGALGAQEGVWVTPALNKQEDPLAIGLKRLGQVMGLDRLPPRAPELPDVPHTYRALLELHDGASFGGAWLRLLGCWEGRGLTVQELNRTLQGRIGRRFVIGFFGNGTLVMMSARGEVQVAAPGDRIPHTVSSNLTNFLENLADDMEIRQQLCSHADLTASQRLLGPLGPDQVLYLQDGETKKLSIQAVWESAQSLL